MVWFSHILDKAMTGPELHDFLIELGWKQKDLASRLGYDRDSVSTWVRGYRKVPGGVAGYVRLMVELRRARSQLHETLGRLSS